MHVTQRPYPTAIPYLPGCTAFFADVLRQMFCGVDNTIESRKGFRRQSWSGRIRNPQAAKFLFDVICPPILCSHADSDVKDGKQEVKPTGTEFDRPLAMLSKIIPKIVDVCTRW